MSSLCRFLQTSEDPNDTPVTEQAKLINTEGTMWYKVKQSTDAGKSELKQFQRWFPPKSGQTPTGNQQRYLVEDHKDIQGFSLTVLEQLKRQGVYYTGPVGDTILHHCYLGEKYELGRYLIEVFGETLVNFPYQQRVSEDDKPGLYEGETVLHLAIVNRKEDEVRYLLEKKASVHARAWGGFFAKGQPCYYGEYPLSFAVCQQHEGIVNLLVENDAPVDAQDSQGNTALHLAVLRNLPRMYRLLVDKHHATERIANKEGLFPLALAAKENNVEMLREIVSYQRQMAWKFGSVVCYSLPLKDIDTVCDPEKASDGHSQNRGHGHGCSTTEDSKKKQRTIPVLKILVEMGNAELINLSYVNDMLQTKWQRFGKWMFYGRMLFYLIMMVCLSILVSFQRETADGGVTFFGRADSGDWFQEIEKLGSRDSLGQLKGDYDADNIPVANRREVVGLEAVCLVLVLGFTLFDIYDKVLWVLSDRQEQQQIAKLPVNDEQERGSVPPLAVKPCDPQWRQDRGSSESSGLMGGTRGEEARPQSRTKTLQVAGTTAARAASRKTGAAFDRAVAFLHRVWRQTETLSFFLYAFNVLMMMHFWIWMNRRADSSWIPWADYTPHQELVLAVFAGWGYMLYFASGFEATGPLVVMILRMLFHDVLKFMLVYLFVAIAFAQALYLLMLHEPDEELTGLQSCNFCSVSDSLLTLFRFTVGDMDFGIFRHPTAHRIVYSIFIAWALASNILMVNLLIALMNSTYESIKQEGQKVWFRKWARLVLLMERRLPVSLRHRFRLGELHYYHGVKEYVYTMTDSEDADLADGGMELKSPTAWGEQDMYSRFHNLLKKHFEVKKSQGKSNKARQELGQAHANVNVQYYANQFQRAVKHSPG